MTTRYLEQKHGCTKQLRRGNETVKSQSIHLISIGLILSQMTRWSWWAVMLYQLRTRWLFWWLLWGHVQCAEGGMLLQKGYKVEVEGSKAWGQSRMKFEAAILRDLRSLNDSCERKKTGKDPLKMDAHSTHYHDYMIAMWYCCCCVWEVQIMHFDSKNSEEGEEISLQNPPKHLIKMRGFPTSLMEKNTLPASNFCGFPEIFKRGQGFLQQKLWVWATVLTSRHFFMLLGSYGRLSLAVAASGIPGGKVSRQYYFQGFPTRPEVGQGTSSLTHLFLTPACPVSNHSLSMNTGPI